MTTKTLHRQGRASGLYDEQLQRQQQEKKLFNLGNAPAEGGLLGRRARAARAQQGDGGET